MKKKIIALLLCICMTVSLLPSTAAYATEIEENEQSTMYTENVNSMADNEVTENTGFTENTEVEEDTDQSEGEKDNLIASTNVLNVGTVNVGDKVWIRSGSKIYKSTEDSTGKEVVLPYAIQIKQLITDESGTPIWYQFEFADFSAILGAIFWKDYSYIKVADTAATEEEAKECNCENPSENIAEHAESCPRKNYIKSLIKNDEGGYKTAREIYKDWDSYDEATKIDVLNMVQAYVITIYEELLEMSKGFRFDTFKGALTNGVNVEVSARTNAFPEGTKMTVSNAKVKESTISDLVVSGDILAVEAIDISFDGEQPANRVSVYINIPDEKVPEEANMYYIIHMADNSPELVTNGYMNTTGKGQTIPFVAESFSTYVVVLVKGKYPAQLMRNVLQGNDQYTIKTLKANLFDYDAVTLNKKLLEAGAGIGFLFPEVGGVDSKNKYGINLGGSTAKQGILNNTLSANGLPIFNYLGEGGEETGKILFDPSYTTSGKEIYKNVDFEFIYDNTNGYYTYNSAWNHAQLNKTDNKVELYADTLSMANEFSVVMDLKSCSLSNQMSNISATSNDFKADINISSQIDPFVVFPISSVDASTVQNIRVRAKIIGKNLGDFSSNFTIYFSKEGSDYQEGQTVTAQYTSNGEWIDFIFDMSTCPAWNGKINGIRLDPIQDNKAEFKNNDFTFEVAWVQLDKKNDTKTDYRNGGYYPFSDISESVPGRADQFNFETWKSNISSEYKGTAWASRALFNDFNDSRKQDNLAFGTVIEQEFYIPVSGKTDFGEDIKYEFTGDDDLWVFIDGQLVLDIGGGHTPVTGAINFTNEQSWVQNAISVTGYDTPQNEDGAEEKIAKVNQKLCAPGIHTMKIFYMERHSGVSNCLMKFNLPLIPSGSVVVSKTVQDQEGKEIDVLKSQEFTFSISGKSQNSSGENLDVKNLSYEVFDTATGKSSNVKTDENGQFKLTATQTAYFNIDENYKVTVEEITPSSDNKVVNGYQWDSVMVNGNKENSDTILTVKEKTSEYKFVNIYKPLYGKLTIAKTGIDNVDNSDSAEQQSSIFRVEGISATGEKISLDVVIVGNDSITIDHIPVGTYTVTEITDWTWRYDVQKDQTVEIKGDKTTEVEFKNVRKQEYWLSGDSYCENKWTKK